MRSDGFWLVWARVWRLMLAIALLALPAAVGADPAAAPRHAIAMYGEPKYGPDFDHFHYVNPESPKGGKIDLAAIGTFDTLNPFTIKGTPAAGLDNTYETLMVASADEPFTEYGLVAESIEVPEDRSWVAFNLRKQARFHDGHPITAEDVVFTFRTLTEKHPFFRAYYAGVDSVRQAGEHRVEFSFKEGPNRELPLILGQLPVLPKHYWQGRDFQKTTLEPPLGSGPYRIAALQPGRSITYERVQDYWGEGLAVNTGRHNFGTIEYDYFRDGTVALLAFKNGLVDFRLENTAKNWATAYRFDAVEQGLVKLEEIPNQLPAGMQAFVFNTRRPVFADPQVRHAIAHAFDFEWVNEVIFYGAYKRTDSYFENSDLQASGLPSEAELELLEPLRGAVPDKVFSEVYEPPSADGVEGLRRNLLTAKRMLEDAGWVIRDGRRVNAETGRPLRFEILLNSPSFERVALPFAEHLARLGIIADVRTVDSAQYVNRIRNFDFDMTVHVWGQSLSPGNEQRNYWGSEAAGRRGSQNLAGIKSKAVDHLIELVIGARTRKSLRTRISALDRVLLWGHYVVPQWYSGIFRVAYWRQLKRPQNLPPYGLVFDAWWIEKAGGASVQAIGGAP